MLRLILCTFLLSFSAFAEKSLVSIGYRSFEVKYSYALASEYIDSEAISLFVFPAKLNEEDIRLINGDGNPTRINSKPPKPWYSMPLVKFIFSVSDVKEGDIKANDMAIEVYSFFQDGEKWGDRSLNYKKVFQDLKVIRREGKLFLKAKSKFKQGGDVAREQMKLHLDLEQEIFEQE